MKSYVLDSHALLTYIRKEHGNLTVRQILGEGLRGQAQIAMSVVNFGEVYFMLCKKSTYAKAETVWRSTNRYRIALFMADLNRTFAAAKLKATYSTSKQSLSYADCFAAALAQELNATLITGDPEFKVLEKVINIQFV